MSSVAEALAAVILAGGAGTRAGGRDKGLVAFRGEPLVLHALRRLHAAGVAEIVISANRNFEDYAQHGRVVADTTATPFEGPLAGIARAATQVRAAHLLTIPVDVPEWPTRLPQDLLDGLSADVACSVARVRGRREPLFAVYRREAAACAHEALARRQRAVHRFQDRIG